MNGIKSIYLFLSIIIIWFLLTYFGYSLYYNETFIDLIIFHIPHPSILQRSIFIIILLILFFRLKNKSYYSKSEHDQQLLKYAEDLNLTLLSLKRYKEAFNAVQIPILVLEDSGLSSIVNPAFLATFKLNTNQVINQHIYSFIPDFSENEFFFNAYNKIKDGEISEFELSLKIYSQLVYFNITIYPLKAFKTQSNSCTIIFENLSGKKRAEKLKKYQNIKLEQAEKVASLGILSAGMAHEINNPNNSIMMNVSLLKKIMSDLVNHKSISFEDNERIGGFKAQQIEDKTNLLLLGIQNGSKRIKNITNVLRDYARNDSGNFKRIDIHKVIESSLKLVENITREKTDGVFTDILQKTPIFISGNFHRLEQVFINLFTNACESFGKKHGELEIETYIEVEENKKVVIIIKDNGIGMDLNIVRHITDPFFTTKRNSGGMGLGLAITSRIIEEHLGNIVFTSIVNEGTTVKLYFPMDEDK